MRKFKTLLLTTLSVFLMFTFAGSAWAQGMAVHDEIRERIERFRMSGRLVVDGVDIAARDVLWRMYEDAGTPTAAATAEFDILLTDSLMRYMYHLFFGKVNSGDLDSDWNLGRKLDRDPVTLVRGAIASDDIREYITQSLDWAPYYGQMSCWQNTANGQAARAVATRRYLPDLPCARA